MIRIKVANNLLHEVFALLHDVVLCGVHIIIIIIAIIVVSCVMHPPLAAALW